MKLSWFCFLLLASPFMYAGEVNTNTATVKEFITAVNGHNLAKMGLLLANNHVFVDAVGSKVEGKESTLATWKGYLQWFPDYAIKAEQLIQNGDTVVVFGQISGTFYKGQTDSANGHWHLPAAIRAVARNGKIEFWQVYADTKAPSDVLNRYSDTAAADKVQGFGGVFFKSANPKELAAWYDKHLGTSFGQQGFSLFWWRDYESKQAASTTFAIFKQSSTYFNPGAKPFMFNFRVTDLNATLNRLKREGVTVVGDVQNFDYGKFGWILDGDSNKIELWEPKDEENQFGKK